MKEIEKTQKALLFRFAIGYLGACSIVSLGLGVARSIWRFATGVLPDQYLLHGVAWNAGLAFALCIVFFPVVLFISFLFEMIARLNEPNSELYSRLSVFVYPFGFWARP